MAVVSGATWAGVIVTKDSTGALMAATVGPVGVLYVNGVADAAVVTIAGVNPYSWSVTLPALADGDCVSMYITATVDGIATAWIVAEDVASTVYLSSRAEPGDAMDLVDAPNATALAALARTIWNALASALTSSGSIGRYLVEQLAAIRARTDRIRSGTVRVLSPVLADGNVSIVRGDVYEYVDGRRLEWGSDDWNIAPSSTVVVIIQQSAVFSAQRLGPSGVGLELASAQTLELPVGVYPFVIQEIRADGDPITLLRGTWATALYPVPRPEGA